MQLILSTRHGEISDRQREEVEEQCARLPRFEPRLSRVELTLSDEKDWWEAEALASIDRAEPVHAHAEGGDPRTAVDQVVDKLARQLKRLRERHTDHQGPEGGSGRPPEGSAT